MSDPMMIPSILSGGLQAIGNIGQGLLNYNSQQQTNAMEVNLANTAIQRRQADLAAAGINPLMAGRIGGADTPTVQAPQMSGIPEAAANIGNIPSNALALQQQQQENQRIASEVTKNQTEASLNQKQIEWFDKLKTNELNIGGMTAQEIAQRITESQATTGEKLQAIEESKARVLTMDAMRQPEVNQAVAAAAAEAANAAKTNAEIPTEQAMAANAAKLYGANADQAVTLAKSMANNFQYQDVQNQLKVNNATLTNQILMDDDTSKTIQNIIDNNYKKAATVGAMNNNPFSTGAIAALTASGRNTPVIPNMGTNQMKIH